jgi:hypothetical protein
VRGIKISDFYWLAGWLAACVVDWVKGKNFTRGGLFFFFFFFFWGGGWGGGVRLSVGGYAVFFCFCFCVDGLLMIVLGDC